MIHELAVRKITNDKNCGSFRLTDPGKHKHIPISQLKKIRTFDAMSIRRTLKENMIISKTHWNKSLITFLLSFSNYG